MLCSDMGRDSMMQWRTVAVASSMTSASVPGSSLSITANTPHWKLEWIGSARRCRSERPTARSTQQVKTWHSNRECFDQPRTQPVITDVYGSSRYAYCSSIGCSGCILHGHREMHHDYTAAPFSTVSGCVCRDVQSLLMP